MRGRIALQNYLLSCWTIWQLSLKLGPWNMSEWALSNCIKRLKSNSLFKEPLQQRQWLYSFIIKMYFLHSVEEFEGVVRDKQDFSKTASLNADVFTFKCEENSRLSLQVVHLVWVSNNTLLTWCSKSRRAWAGKICPLTLKASHTAVNCRKNCRKTVDSMNDWAWAAFWGSYEGLTKLAKIGPWWGPV